MNNFEIAGILISALLLGVYLGRKTISLLVQNYIRRMVILRYGRKLLRILTLSRISHESRAEDITVVFSRLEVCGLMSDFLSDCRDIGIETDEIAHVMNTQCPYPNATWEGVPNGLTFRTQNGKATFTSSEITTRRD